MVDKLFLFLGAAVFIRFAAAPWFKMLLNWLEHPICKYSKWSEPTFVEDFSEETRQYGYCMQTRKCEICGKIEQREI